MKDKAAREFCPKSGKVIYPNPVSAHRGPGWTGRAGKRWKSKRTVYACTDCGGWHSASNAGRS